MSTDITTISRKNFKFNADDVAMLTFIKKQNAINKDVDVVRFSLAKTYASLLRDKYASSEVRDFMTFDEFVMNELYKQKKSLGVI